MLSTLKQGFQKVLDYLVATPAGHGVLVPYPHVQPMFTSTPSGLGEGFNLAVQVRKEDLSSFYLWPSPLILTSFLSLIHPLASIHYVSHSTMKGCNQTA